MGEDMTYQTTMTLADWRNRARELEARLAVLEPSGFALANSALIQRVHQLEAQNAELLAAAVTNAQDMLALRVECDGLRAQEQSREFWRSAALNWKERCEAVPLKILREDYHKRFGTRELRWWPEWALPIGKWLFPEVQPDDTDAPLKLAQLDEDGDE